MSSEITFEIKRSIGILEEYPTGWKKELTLISWNGNPAKYDIRDWNPEHTHMSKGITLTQIQMDRLIDSVLAADSFK